MNDAPSETLILFYDSGDASALVASFRDGMGKRGIASLSRLPSSEGVIQVRGEYLRL